MRTKGIWHVLDGTKVMANGELICDTSNPRLPKRECVANARLIASSKLMLNWLKLVSKSAPYKDDQELAGVIRDADFGKPKRS